MRNLADDRSIVAIDPSPRGLAFVSFENGVLLDWGTRRRDDDEIVVLDGLLDCAKADVLVLEDPDAPRCERRPRTRRLLRLIRDHAAKRGVAVVAVSRYAVRQEWAKRDVTAKHAAAAAIGAMMPEIEYLVPRPRKPYRSEEARAHIFDAASLALHALGIETGRTP